MQDTNNKNASNDIENVCIYSNNHFPDSCDEEIESLFNLAYSTYCDDSMGSLNGDLVFTLNKNISSKNQKYLKNIMKLNKNSRRPDLNFQKMRQV